MRRNKCDVEGHHRWHRPRNGEKGRLGDWKICLRCGKQKRLRKKRFE